MSIMLHEKELFRRWGKHHISLSRLGEIVTDGVVDETAFQNDRPRLAFVLKEANDKTGGGWDLRQYLREGGRPQTWDNVTRWIIGMRQLPTDLPWETIAAITKEQRMEHLRSVAAMNLKKWPGGDTTIIGKLKRAAKQDGDLIREQFLLYDADVAICCGSDVSYALSSVLAIQSPEHWPLTRRGLRYKEHSPGKYIVEHCHPEARVSDCLLYYGLVDACREILGVKASC